MLAATEGALRTAEGTVFPLLGTDVAMEVAGRLNRVEVAQTFRNPLERWAEATYQFPLPHDAAVFRARFTIGERVVEARVAETEQARRELAQARAEGKTAVLLEQERPDLFSMTLTQIAPGETIEVAFGYDAPVAFDDGEFRVLFPLVTADRFALDADARPEQVHARIASAAERRDPVSLRARIRRDGRADRPVSPTHPIRIRETRQHYEVELAGGDKLANRDFELHWGRIEESFQPQLWLERTPGREGTFMLSMIPPATMIENPPPRDVLLLVDRSFSMRGEAWELAREAALFIADDLRPEDALQLVFFDHDLAELYPGEAFRSRIQASDLQKGFADHPPRGGTELEKALRRVTSKPRRRGRELVCALLTDASLGNEGRLARLAAGTGERLFVLGIGPSVNRYLVERLARDTGGACDCLSGPQPAVLARFRRRLMHGGPVLRNVELHWEGVEPDRMAPEPARELYAGQPLELAGRYERAGVGRLILTATTANGTRFSVAHRVEFPETTEEVPGLERFWARAQVQAWLAQDAAAHREEIVGLALAHSLVTPFTSLVGADSVARSKTADPAVLEVPAPAAASTPPAPFAAMTLEEKGGAFIPECSAEAGIKRSLARGCSEGFSAKRGLLRPSAGMRAGFLRPFLGRGGNDKPMLLRRPIADAPPTEDELACFRRRSPDRTVPPTSPPPSQATAQKHFIPTPGYSPEELAWARGHVDGALDLVFVVDETGSMGAYILEVQTRLLEIIAAIRALPLCRQLRLGLVRYRDHPPQDQTFVTRVHPLTEDLDAIRRAVLEMHASGGGDGPEAVTDALHELVRLNWRPQAMRTAIWVGDAPPHGVEPGSDGFPQGPPSLLHWFTQAESCREMGIAIHAVGCEPGLNSYANAVAVYRQVAETARGTFIPLRQASLLLPIVAGTAALDLDRQRIAAHVAALVDELGPRLQSLEPAAWSVYLASIMRARGVSRYTMRGTTEIAAADITVADVEEALERIA
ncbi:MAG: VWA domain-containing protein [Armatimonadetes bacterium]|nr:VWA domain-containing protein [Armatimonadota bacterium]